MRKQNKGFTLLEILLVIAAIGILAAIVLVAINPTKQIESARSAQRRSEINSITKAIQQYSIDNNGQYPVGIETGAKPICNTGSLQTGGPICTGFVDLKVLVPTYIASIPQSDSNNYYVRRSNNNNIEVSHPRDTIWNIGGTPSLDLNFAKNKSLIDGVSGNNLISFARNSTATYVGEDGLIKTAAANEARFDHNPVTGESLGLLVEEQRTNLRTYSAAPNASNNYRIYGTPTYNSEVAPDGTATATLIAGNGATVQGFDTYSNDYGSSSNATQTYSVYVKNVNATNVSVHLTNQKYVFTFATETGVASGATGGFQKLSNGWYRIWVTAVKTNVFWFQQVLIDNGASTSAAINFWGVQLENASFPTSYIPTTSATVTRAADVASITGSNFSSWYNNSEGTLFANARSSGSSSNNFLAGLDSTSAFVFADILELSSSVRLSVYGTNNAGIFNYSPSTSGALAGSTRKAAIAIKSGNFGAALNGIASTTGTDTTGYPTFNRLSIMSLANYGGANGTIARLTYWPTRLSNTVLQNITQ